MMGDRGRRGMVGLGYEGRRMCGMSMGWGEVVRC